MQPRRELCLPEDVWIHVFSFLSTREKHSVRATCSYFREVVDKCPSLWRDFCVVLSRVSRYDRGFWRTLGRRHVRTVVLRGCGGGERKHLRRLLDALPAVTAVAVEDWLCPDPKQQQPLLDPLVRFSRLTSLAFHNSPGPLDVVPVLQLLALQVTRLSVCNVKLRSPAVLFLGTVATMRNLTRLRFHHDGSERVPLRAVHELLGGLAGLRELSWEMVSSRTLPDGFFSPPAGPPALPLSSLELVNYDTEVSAEVVAPLRVLRRLSVGHLYSVPGPHCHLRTWLLALPRLTHLGVHGGHRLGAYADCVPETVVGLKLCVDLTLEDLEVLGARLPRLQHLHLEPWGTAGTVGVLPRLFPQLRTLHIRHHNVPESDFLGLALLDKLRYLEVLDWYSRPAEGRAPSSLRLPHLIDQLRQLTNNRVHVTSRRQQDPLLCQCLS